MSLNNLQEKDFRYYEKGFDMWVEMLGDQYNFDLLIQNTPVCFFTETTTEMINSRDCTDKLRCRTCRERILFLLSMRDINNKSLLFPKSKKDYDVSLHKLFDASRTGKICKSEIMSKEDFDSSKKGGYHHFCAITNLTDLDFTEIKKKKKISNKYFDTFFNFFTTHGVKGTIETLNTLIKHLEKVVYGDKLRESAKWFKKHIVDNFKELSVVEKHKIIYEAMFDQPNAKDIESKDVTLIYFDQFKNNTLDALKVADDLDSLGKLLESRLNPKKYCVKTAEPTEKQVDVAIKLIGDFSVTLMTFDEVIEKLNGIKINQEKPIVTKSISAMKGLSTKKKSKDIVSCIANFGIKTKNFNSVSTFDDIIDLAPDKLEINTSNLHVLIVNKFEGLSPDIYKYDYTWGYYNASTVKDINLNGEWQKVTGIMKLGDRNYLITLENAQINKKMMGICCHTQLLNNDYRKSLEQVWGNLHSTMKLQYPESGPYAIGVGVSQEIIEDGSAPRVRNGVSFRVDGVKRKVY